MPFKRIFLVHGFIEIHYPLERTRVGKLNHFVVTGPKDLVAVIAPDSFHVNQTAIHNIEDELRGLGVQVIEYKAGTVGHWNGGGGKGLVVITGHSSEELAHFVDAVGAAGFFRDNYVLFNSCETPLTREMISAINSKHGALATFEMDPKNWTTG